MEFLRFGSSIPGSYWGCCACCIIQNFNFDPDQKMSIQLVSGDGGQAIPHPDGGALFAGPTYRDIFNQRIRSGTFEKRDMPNHAFLAILTENQINGVHGKKWLAILRETGFEFIRTVCNSVYAGPNLLGAGKPSNSSMNHMFGLFRNIGTGSINDPFTPPKAWTDLPSVKTEAWTDVGGSAESQGRWELANLQREQDLAIWNTIGPAKFLSEKEVVAAGAPIILAGQRSKYPQQEKKMREGIKAAEAKMKDAHQVFENPAPVVAPTAS